VKARTLMVDEVMIAPFVESAKHVPLFVKPRTPVIDEVPFPP
jgi:hypothetical protein